MPIATDSLQSSTATRLSLEDYLKDENGMNLRCELLDGVLVDMGAESRLNEKIALWLLKQLLRFVEVDLIARGTQIQVRSEWAKTRNPDLMILTEALDAARLPPELVRYLFELAVQHQIFDFPKLNRLGEFSLIT